MNPNSAARIVSNTSRYTSITPVLKKLHWLHVEHRSATLVYKFLHIGSSKYFALYISSYSSSCGTRHRVVVTSLLFQSSNPLTINLSSSLVIVLLLMPPLFGMLFLMRFVSPPPKPLSESSSKPTCTPRHTHLSLTHPLAFSVVLGVFSVTGH